MEMNEEKAKKILSKFIQDGNILTGETFTDHIFWFPSENTVGIEGEFTLEEIEALAWWIKNKNE
jgi:hypothetical protein